MSTRTNQKDSGSTLVEVIIASMVLSLTGVVLVGGFLVSRTVQQKTTTKAMFLNTFIENVQQIKQIPYSDCRNGNPYLLPNMANYSITVDVLNNTDSWVSCDINSSVNQVQLITISANDGQFSASQQVVKIP